MNKVKFLTDDSLASLERRLNEFCDTHEVYATQFLQHDPKETGVIFIVAIWYRTGPINL